MGSQQHRINYSKSLNSDTNAGVFVGSSGEYSRTIAKPSEIWIRPGATDGRKGLSSLIAMIIIDQNMKPDNGSLYVFCHKGRTRLKMVFFDGEGVWLLVREAREKRFPWPDTDSEAMKIKEGELLMLIDGIDFFRSGTMLKLAR